jgi:hypothetical protein
MRDALEEKEMKKYTFKPKILKKSEELAINRSRRHEEDIQSSKYLDLYVDSFDR